MANLIERITIGDTDKIPIHPFIGALNEYRRGKVTGAQLIAAFNLDAAQTTQAQTLVDLWGAAPDKTEFARVFKDIMYLAESGYDTSYQNIATVQTRLETEVTDQGGTLP